MSELLTWLKEAYRRVLTKDLEWKPLHPENAEKGLRTDAIYNEICLPKHGIYNTHTYVRFIVDCEYVPGIDGRGERYYTLDEIIIEQLDEPLMNPDSAAVEALLQQKPQPGYLETHSTIRRLFDSKDAAIEAVYRATAGMLSSLRFQLSDAEQEDLEAFWDQFPD